MSFIAEQKRHNALRAGQDLTNIGLLVVFTICLFAGHSNADELLGQENDPDRTITGIMSLNIYGHATMPAAAETYARLAKENDVAVLAIQEGVEDWQIESKWPVDYSRAEALHNALGTCWQREFQVLVNECAGFSLVEHRRFDLPDGPNAVRTGESAKIIGPFGEFGLINVHWDHESAKARTESARVTAEHAARFSVPLIVVGDFNTECDSQTSRILAESANLVLSVDAGIDCILVRNLPGTGQQLEASPSDHPAVVFYPSRS